MKQRKPRAGHRAIQIGGTLLVVYLAALIGFGVVGQRSLRAALVEQEQLSIDKQATALSYFLASQQAVVDELAGSQAVQAFLANRHLGMSMRYGLRASLTTVARTLRRTLDAKRINGRPIFTRMRYADESGATLVDVGAGGDKILPDRSAGPVPPRNDLLEAASDGAGVGLSFAAWVRHKGEPGGRITADLSAVEVLQPLLASTGEHSQRRVALVRGNDAALIADARQDWSDWRQRASERDLLVLEAPVGTTGLRVVSVVKLTGIHGALTSPWLLGALAVISLPLLIGMGRLLRLSNHNLILATRIDANRRQRSMLRKHNERLQREIEKRLASEHQLAHQANYDQLTGLPNRSLALDRLAQAVKQARREDGSVMLLFLDLDRFKQVNDSLGHAAGDALLREAAQRLSRTVRESDTVSRLGGDEFLVICPESDRRGNWERCAEQMLKVLAQPFYIGDHEFFVGASIGAATFPDGGDEPHKLLKNADIAMYAAKEQGRNRYCHYDPSMDAMALESMRLENNLRHALSRGELHLVFQPIVSLSSGQTVAVEALLRWTSHELGVVPPDKFIPIAEETGLIHEIGEWVLTEACQQIGSLASAEPLRVSVNLSCKQFSRPGRLLDCVLHALRSSGLMPGQLELEITESILIDDRSEIAELLHQLDRIGVRLSIDDFGTGYSALNYLQRFPFDVLKIDRSFTAQVPQSDASATLIRAIIALAHALDLQVIAEGIETRDQAGFLLVQHCEFGQGYLYSRPLRLAELAAHLDSERALSA